MRPSSSDPSGSSSSSSRGFDNSARPSATRWRSPPESFPGRRSEQIADVEQVGDARALRGIVGEAVHAPPVVEVLPHVEMRKQPRILEHIADAAPVRRHVHALGGVVERLAVEGDDAAIGPQQSRDHVDQRGLAGAGSAEQAGDAALAGEGGGKREFAELFCDVDAQHGQFPCRRCVARRANHSGGDQGAHRDHDGDDHQPPPPRLSPSGVWISE